MRPPASPAASQVSWKTAFTVCFAVVATAALVLFILKTTLAITLTVASAMIAVALQHGVDMLVRRGWSRRRAIALVVVVLLLAIAGFVLLLVPPVVGQVRSLIEDGPQFIERFRKTAYFERLDSRFGLEQRFKDAAANALGLASKSVSPVLGAIGGVLSGIFGFASVLALSIFMLVFGGNLMGRLLSLAAPANRPLYERIMQKAYASVGGYIGGLVFICSVNATLTTSYLAISRTPFFLPLGILSGFSSLVPYAGPIVAGGVITLVALVTGGLLKAGITILYFLLYGQFEGNILGPFVFRRTVHLDPLVTFLSILFLAELLGIPGAVVAVPAVAVAQILVHELLAVRAEAIASLPSDEIRGPPRR